MNMRPTLSLLVGLLAIVSVTLVFFPFQIPGYRDVYNNIVLDNYDHWLPCRELPTTERIEATLSQHRDALERIRAVDTSRSPGVSVRVESEMCGKERGDLLIEYGAHQQREQIEEILGDQTFFGIPVRLRNI